MRKTLWYIKRNGHITGPFPSQVIESHLSLKRLSHQDLASQDRHHWQQIQAIPELKTNKQKSIETDLIIDERNGFDRRRAQRNRDADTNMTDRRSPESNELIRRRRLHTHLMARFRQTSPPIFWPLSLVSLFLLFLAINAITSPTLLPVSTIACNTEAGRAVNWNNCQKPRQQLTHLDMSHAQLRSTNLSHSNIIFTQLNHADMAYANLSHAVLNHSQLRQVNLIGADLSYADLSYADLSGSDLSYANLSHANLNKATLDNVTLDQAILPNGEVCHSRALNACLPITPP